MLGSAQKRKIEEFPEEALHKADPVVEGPVPETAAAPAAATDAPARPSVSGLGRRGTRATAVDEKADASFASIPGAESMEAKIAAVGGGALDEPLPLGDIPDAPVDTVPSDPAGGEQGGGESSSGETEDKDKPKDPELDELDEDVPLSAFDWLGSEHNRLVNLLQTALPAEEAAELAQQYHQYIHQETFPRIAALDKLSEQERERLRQQAEAEAANQVQPAGAVSSLLGSLFGGRPRGADTSKLEDIGNQRRAIIDQTSGVAAEMNQRIAARQLNAYTTEMARFQGASAAMTRAINSYNAAILSDDASADLRQQVAEAARQAGITEMDVLADLTKGGGSDQLRQTLAEACKATSDNPTRKEAEKQMAEHAERMEESLKKAARLTEDLQKNPHAECDPVASKKRFLEELEQFQEDAPKPLDESKRKELMDRMKELGDSVAQAMQALIERLMQRVVGAATP